MKNASAEQQKIIKYEWEVSEGNKDFILTLATENGLISIDRQSEVYKNGRREPSYGLCQIDKDFHPEIVNDPRFFTDYKFQVEQCWKLYSGGTKFYAHKIRFASAGKFIFED